MSDRRQLNSFERFLTLFTRVEVGEGRCIGFLCLQAFTLMVAYYLIRPVREALILTEGTAELRSYAVGVQAVLLILLIPVYGLLVRRAASNRVFQFVIAFFALNLVVFFFLGQGGLRFSFVFFVWASLFAVMAVAQFWAFATDLVDVHCGTRLFGVIAAGVSSGAWVGASLASACYDALGPHGLMLASAAVLCVAICLSEGARRSVPNGSRSATPGAPTLQSGPAACASHWLGGLAIIGRSRYLIAIAALVVLVNWMNSTGDFVLSSWLSELAREQAPDAQGAFIGKFMGRYSSTIALVGFLVQLLFVSRIITTAGIAKALLVTPIAFVAGYLLIGIVPVFALLQSVLVVHKSLDYSLLNTTRSALLLPASRDEKYQGKTAIDTLFFRFGDLLSTLTVFAVMRLFGDARMQFVWLMVIVGATMTAVAWLIGREYARRYGAVRPESGDRNLSIGGGRPALAQ